MLRKQLRARRVRPAVVTTMSWVENCCSGSLQVTRNSFSSGNSWRVRTPLLSLSLSWRRLCFRTSTLVSSSNTTRHHYSTACCISLHEASLSYLCLFSTGDVRALNCLAQPRQIPITSDAICSQRCTGAKMEALAASLSLMSEIKCYAWQSLPKMKFFATRRYIWGIRSKSVWCHSRMGRRGRFASGGEFLLCLYIFMYVCLCICNIYVYMKQRLCLCG